GDLNRVALYALFGRPTSSAPAKPKPMCQAKNEADRPPPRRRAFQGEILEGDVGDRERDHRRTMQDYMGHRDPKRTAHYTWVAGRRFEGALPLKPTPR